MPPIEVGAPRAIGAVAADITRKSGPQGGLIARTNAAPASVGSVTAQPSIATTEALEAGQAPVDAERVSQIRKAVESGNYPLVPTRIADAMIAAGILLRSGNA